MLVQNLSNRAKNVEQISVFFPRLPKSVNLRERKNIFFRAKNVACHRHDTFHELSGMEVRQPDLISYRNPYMYNRLNSPPSNACSYPRAVHRSRQAFPLLEV